MYVCMYVFMFKIFVCTFSFQNLCTYGFLKYYFAQCANSILCIMYWPMSEGKCWYGIGWD